jgi:imidazolonepropionase-like amidohydrolase
MNTHPTAIHAARLWDGTGADITYNATVVITRDRIEYAGSRLDFAGESISLPDATLLPGLIDSHVHLSDDGWFPLELLSCGVTTVRDTGNNHHVLIDLRERQRRGDWLGPRIRTCGPVIDRRPAHWGNIAREVMPEDDVETIVDELLDDGVDGLKLYAHIDPSVAERVIRRANVRGAPVTIHGGTCMASLALGFGIGCIEHVSSLDAMPDTVKWEGFDPSHDRFTRIIDLFGESGAHFCPTLAVMEGVEFGWGPRLQTRPGYERYPEFVATYLRGIEGGDHWEPERVATANERFDGMMVAVRHLYEAGVSLLAGSDAPFVPPGHGFHTELEYLAECGIPNHDVLRIATLDAARYLGIESEVGTLEPGKLADMVAVTGDPLVDITAVRNIHAVWQGGQRLDPLELGCRALMASKEMTPPLQGCPPWGIPYDNGWTEDMR